MNQLSIKKKNQMDALMIDDWFLDERISEILQNKRFANLYCAWEDLDDSCEEAYIWQLLTQQTACYLPILVCPDDADLSCILMVVDLEYTANYVVFRRVGEYLRTNFSLLEWQSSGLLNPDNWEAEDFDSYFVYYDLLRTDPLRDEYLSRYWPVERMKRIWGYEHKQFNTEENINWLIHTKFEFSKDNFAECLVHFSQKRKKTMI